MATARTLDWRDEFRNEWTFTIVASKDGLPDQVRLEAVCSALNFKAAKVFDGPNCITAAFEAYSDMQRALSGNAGEEDRSAENV